MYIAHISLKVPKLQFTIAADDLLSNTMSADRALSEKSFNDAGDKVNKDKWYMSPATVNAYYNPKVLMIEIIFDYFLQSNVSNL